MLADRLRRFRAACFYALRMAIVISTLISTADAQVLFDEILIDGVAPTDPWMKAMGDLNGDGQLDLVVAARNGPLVWYEYPNWDRHQINAGVWVGGTATDVDCADLDGDGDQDVILANGYWFENPDLPSGNPITDTWTAHNYGSDTGHDVVIADLDNDSDLDVVTRNQGSTGDAILIFRHDGLDTWTRISLTSNVPEGEGIYLTDLDGNGFKDLVIGDRWFANDGDLSGGAWTMRLYTGVAATEQENIVATGDINGDGRVDVAITPAERNNETGKIAWFEAPIDPTTTNWIEHAILDPTESVHHTLQLADFDSDGDLDLVTARMHQGDNPDEVAVFYNDDGDGLSWTKQVLSTEASHNMQAGDIDNDGDIDFFGANWDSSAVADNGDIKLWRNRTGPQGLTLDDWDRHLIDDSLPYKFVFIDAGDLNGDDKPDLATGPYWYENPGLASGAWIRHTVGSPFNQFALLQDFDGDNELDLFGTDGNFTGNDFHWARNDGSGNFTIFSNISSPATGDFLQGVTSGVYVSGQPLMIAISWHQASQGVQMFSLPAGDVAVDNWSRAQIAANSEDEGLSSGDIDGDGDLDILQGENWLRNNGNGTWTQFPTNAFADPPDRNRLADIDGDGDLDGVIGFDAATTSLIWIENPADPESDTWPIHTIDASVGGGYSLDAADMDGDGNPDVILGEHRGAHRVLIYENNGDGSGWVTHVVDDGSVGSIDHHDGTRVIDIDGDTDFDIISIGYDNEKVWVFENRALDPAPTPVTVSGYAID